MPVISNNGDYDRDVILLEFNKLKEFAIFDLKTKPHQSALGWFSFSLTFKEMFDLRRKINWLLDGIEEEKPDNRSAMEKLWSKRQTVSDFPHNNYQPVIKTCFFCGLPYDSYNDGKCVCGHSNAEMKKQ